MTRWGVSPRSVVEPTCGLGAFLRAAIREFPECETALGFDVEPKYVEAAGSIERARVRRADAFTHDWESTFERLPDPVLVVGNPPWVTNSAVGAVRGTNLPRKSNRRPGSQRRRFSGIAAITGKSNFDVSEWMLLRFLNGLSGRSATLAMLCKTAVARKALRQAWDGRLQIEKSAIHAIDASGIFGVSVSACLLVCVLEPGADSRECAVYPSLEATEPESRFALRGRRLVADPKAARATERLAGPSPVKWRSGIKHDCSKVMELFPAGDGSFKNALGEVVRLESTCLFPMLKSSELVRSRPRPSRFMLVTQRSTGDDTSRLEAAAPRTWQYLESHAQRLDGRASAIYENRPRFSIFGVGDYAFAPWKVAISGFYKRLSFRAVGPVDGKPVVLDDTCYFLPCSSEADARALEGVLLSDAAREYFAALVFWDAKRPITAGLLGSLNLGALAGELGVALPSAFDPVPALSL